MVSSPPSRAPSMPLVKRLVAGGAGSRRRAAALIISGAVSVNGQPATNLNHPVRSSDAVSVSGQPLAQAEERTVYLLLNKPPGYLCAVSDSRGRPHRPRPRAGCAARRRTRARRTARRREHRPAAALERRRVRRTRHAPALRRRQGVRRAAGQSALPPRPRRDCWTASRSRAESRGRCRSRLSTDLRASPSPTPRPANPHPNPLPPSGEGARGAQPHPDGRGKRCAGLRRPVMQRSHAPARRVTRWS